MNVLIWLSIKASDQRIFAGRRRFSCRPQPNHTMSCRALIDWIALPRSSQCLRSPDAAQQKKPTGGSCHALMAKDEKVAMR
jgi:hypothetical protein